MDEKFILAILESKENRRALQISLIDRYECTLISFTLNTPGREKDRESYRKAHRKGMDYILEKLEEKGISILYKEDFQRTTGPEGYILVEEDPLEIKILMIEIEESHGLGRIFDIDVFDKDKEQISRKSLGLRGRICLICNEDARICMREKSHSSQDLIGKVDDILEEYFNLTNK